MRILGWLGILVLLLGFGGLHPESDADDLPGVVFVSDDIFGPKYEWPGQTRPGTSHWREGYLYHRSTTQHPLERTTTPTRPGANLFTLVPPRPDGKLTRITHLTDGEVFDPEPSYDGNTILFSMRRDGEDWFNLYEIDCDGSNLKQLTDGPFNDVSGVYLPDGRIVFISDRAGYLEEYHEERTETLWIMNGDGTGIEQLTFNPGTAFDPTVLHDGRILFSLWDVFALNIPGLDKHETYLMTVRPDGTGESHFFGVRQYRFFDRERHSGFAMNQATEMPDGRILGITEMGPSILDPSRGTAVADAVFPVFPGCTTIQLGGATHRVHLSPIGSRSTPYALPDGRFLLSATLPGARDMGIYICDPQTRETTLIYNAPDTSEFDPRPIFLQRTRPKILPPLGQCAGATRYGKAVPVTGRARFAVVNGRRSDNPEHEKALRHARYYQVTESLHTAVTSSSHTNLATRILGVTPILPDGSAYFEAPADTPLTLIPLDASGRRILFDWNLPVSSVPLSSKQELVETAYISARPGEQKSCNGCHAPDEESPGQPDPEYSLALTLGPVQLKRDTTDILFRRNEPDEYRSKARIGEAPRYAAWLSSQDCDVRRRGCELLSAMEDGGRHHTDTIADLLNDESTEVRRAATIALGRLGSVKHAPALIERLEDHDWQARFHATVALEAITGCPTPAGEEEAHTFYREMLTQLEPEGGLLQAIGKGPDAFTVYSTGDDSERLARWCEAVGRLGKEAPDSARKIVRDALRVLVPPPVTFVPLAGQRQPLVGEPPELAAIRAAGWMQDAAAVELLIPWLEHYEYQDHITEVTLALGRIGTPEAVDALWQALRRDVPNLRPYLTRYLQRGPRPEEYAMLRALILADAPVAIEDVHLIIALAPGTFLEKPRYEDRLRPETQRVLLGRILLDRCGQRTKAVELLVSVLRGNQMNTDDPLYQQILKGINLERPFAEHRRPFPVVEKIEPEQALWLLGCLAENRSEVPTEAVTPYLTSEKWRERIDAAVILNLHGVDSDAATILEAEIAKPYPFKEIMGIGKSHYDENFRDKCYMAMALAHHVDDVDRLRTFADPKARYRDIRYGLAVGLGYRGTPDGIDLAVEIATTDPISAVRRQAREALLAIQETQQLAGNPVLRVTLPDPVPFEVHYPCRGLSWPDPKVVKSVPATHPSTGSLEEIHKLVTNGLQSEHFRNLNNANNQAPGATHMMVSHISELDQAVSLLGTASVTAADPTLHDLLSSPYPFARYLALRETIQNPSLIDQKTLIAQLDRSAKAVDPVGFYWTCEALAQLRAEAAIPTLTRYATGEPVKNLHGPAGMGYGYPAAKAIGRITGQIDHPEVQRLLAEKNVWLVSGVLAGLTEAEPPGIRDLLVRFSDPRNPAIIRSEARVELQRLKKVTVTEFGQSE